MNCRQNSLLPWRLSDPGQGASSIMNLVASLVDQGFWIPWGIPAQTFYVSPNRLPTNGMERDLNSPITNYILKKDLPVTKPQTWDNRLLTNFWPRDFPGGPVVKNPPCNAGDTGSIPGGGTKIPHAVGQLSLRATTTELTHLN